MEPSVSPPQPVGNGNSINPFLSNQRIFSIPNNNAGAQVALTEPIDVVQGMSMPMRPRINMDSSTTIKSPCVRQSATLDHGQTRAVPLETTTYYYPPSFTPFAPVLQDSTDERTMDDIVVNQPNIARDISDRHTSEYAPSSPSFRFKWEGCTSTRQFSRVGDLIRHIKSIHITPEAYPCKA
ncbi:hypothetical protein ASPSYDRAFT_63302 [Aspergillus sydowii CBS 593.65]|uniref:C2H2-type domain-containing protein n=1 Tax=Aspergillus sydowii CBS 593.65 TaxID=1036612 RepID=A0A1L9TVK9_9EURO|nr:uncharacterized protein ASPSYDRAFT_63302 [Aspergillus sydowii CBS 593.65]OJJ63470.1 hypothetical protein ASPSYDRAFT_63302 [Aspergillus sydowii CBS 593.65]